MSDLEFPFEYREGQRKIVSGVYHTISTERQIFVQAPTGVGKTMSTIFPAVRAVGAGLGENIFYLTAKTTNGRCVTSKDAAELMESVFPDTTWLPAKDSRSIITRRYETVRFEEKGDYYLTWGAAGVPKQGERYSGDNYSFCERGSCQVMFSLCDGMGSGAVAGQESRRIVELLEALLEAGFAPDPLLNW